MNAGPGRLRLVSDTSPGDWLGPSIGEFDWTVGALVPRGFEAYARILHPADSPDEEPVTWAEVADWTGGTLYPRVQFAALTRTRTNPDTAPPWDEEPNPGDLAPPLLTALCEVLSAHTRTPQRCWFCLWDGYGWLHGPPATAIVTATLNGENEPPPAIPATAPDWNPEGPRVRLPHRDYLLFEGPIDAAVDLGDQVTADFFAPQSPNVFWPDDRAWCVTTDIDLDSTYVGGPQALIDDLLADPRLETLPCAVDDPITTDSDTINTSKKRRRPFN